MEHCKQEVKIAVLENNLPELKADVQEIKSMVGDIYKILNGNGNEGLVTKVSLARSSLNRLWVVALGIPSATVAIIAIIKFAG